MVKMEKIKEMVTEQEMKKLDKAVAEIYNVEYDNNYSVAYNLGFDTVSNLNGSGYENLVRIVDSLNDGGEDEAFARFILEKVFNDNKVERLKKELEKNRNRYIRILYL
jgi:hypothetical protein